jgi:hypothetical protein
LDEYRFARNNRGRHSVGQSGRRPHSALVIRGDEPRVFGESFAIHSEP